MWKWLVAFMLLSGCSWGEEAPQNIAMPLDTAPESVQNPAQELQLLRKEETGQYLADTAGQTLYYSRLDEENVSRCTGSCLTDWPPFYIGSADIPDGYSPADFGVIKRPDTGEKQSTFKGKPLYYFARDFEAGDTNGYGLDENWYTVNNALNQMAAAR